MGRAWNAGRRARVAKLVTEGLLGEWPPNSAANEGEISARLSGHDLLKLRRDREYRRHVLIALLGIEDRDFDALDGAEMLSPESNRIPAPQSGL
jgi:hypothetical protein